MNEHPLIFGRPLIGDDEIDEVVAVLRSGWIGAGPRVDRLERMLERYCRAPHARCVTSCSVALRLALRCGGVGRGNEVIVPAMTFVASANAVESCGATPVLVDSEPATGLIDLGAADAAATDRTRALLVVDLAGRPVNRDGVERLARKHGLAVVEDAAQSLGGAWAGVPIGGHGNLTCFSFDPCKNATAGEGGAIATADAELAERVRRLSRQGFTVDTWDRVEGRDRRLSEVVEPGTKATMSDVHAAIAIHQLRRLDAEIERRARQAALYDRLLDQLPLELPAPVDARARSTHHLYSVRVPPLCSRDELATGLRERGIGTGVHYRAVHLQRYYRERYSLRPGDLPVAAEISARTLSLPVGPTIAEADQERVAAALAELLSPHERRFGRARITTDQR